MTDVQRIWLSAIMKAEEKQDNVKSRTQAVRQRAFNRPSRGRR